MGYTNGMQRTRNDGLTYGLYIAGKKRRILVAEISDELCGYTVTFEVAEITNENALREVFEGLFGGDWR